MALDTSRRNGRGGMLLTRRGGWGFSGTNTAARQAEAEQWMADHAAELDSPEPRDLLVIPADPTCELDWGAERAAEDLDEFYLGGWDADHDIDVDEARTIMAAHEAAAEEAAGWDPLSDPDLPGWGDHFDPEELQWGFRVTTIDKAPGVTSGRPIPSGLQR